MDFWTRLDNLIAENPLIIDRPRGSTHPRYPDIIYPLDYGFLKGTSGGDGNEIDVWRGTLKEKRLVAIVCTIDAKKRDAEIKLLIGCGDDEINTINKFHNEKSMSSMVIRRP
jgi:inorganic pyrophosphatase